MRFVNKGKPVQVRIREKTGYRWECVKTNQIINLSESVGLANGFKKVNSHQQSPLVTEGKIGKTKVETKQIDFLKELQKINGIGKKTAEDLFLVFPTKESLIDALKKGRIPIRDDIEKKLRGKYGN